MRQNTYVINVLGKSLSQSVQKFDPNDFDFLGTVVICVRQHTECCYFSQLSHLMFITE